MGRVTIAGAGLAAIALVVLLASGCGYGSVVHTSTPADTQNGKLQFAAKCGYCHTLAAAATSGTIGPNLDNAFAGSRELGYSQSTIENLVLDQIRQGSGPIATYTSGEHGVSGLTPQKTMPANAATGQDAIDIAAYVASVAGMSYTFPCNLAASVAGADIFSCAGCASCHTLKASGSTGTAGPNLDQLKPSESRVSHQVMVGGGLMPSFTGTLTPAQIAAVAKYVSSVAGK
jgi:mono/diheme cytochrome c family protein